MANTPTKTKTRQKKETRLRWLQRQLRAVQSDLKAARKETSWTAVQNLHKEARTFRAEIDRLHLELAAEDEVLAKSKADENMTAEEWEERNRDDARVATDAALDIYMEEWLARRRYKVVVEEGELRLERLAS